MAVTATGLFTGGLFVPFRTAKRGGRDGGDPVGSYYFDGGAVGAAGGGTVTIILAMQKEAFGFHPLFVPTHIDASDTLATAEEVQLIYDPAGNSRIAAGNGIRESVLAVAGSATNDVFFTAAGIIVEPSEDVDTSVLAAVWKTNTDTKTYHFHIFGMLFDAEIMAREESKISELLMGVR